MDIINPYIHGGEAVAFDGFGNRSRSFDGVDDIVELNQSTPDNAIFTASTWLKLKTHNSSTGEGVFGKWQMAANGSWLIYVDATNIRFIVRNGANTAFTIVDSGISSSSIIGEWTHIAGVADGTNLTIYINGVSAASIAYDGTINNPTTATVIGAYNNTINSQHFTDGNIADCRLYNIALTATEISDIYNGTNITTNLVGHWLTDADNLLDAAGTNHGTNYGSKYSYDNPSPPVEFGSASRFFDGTSDRVESIGTTSSFNFIHASKVFTITVWAKWDEYNTNNAGALVSNNYAGNSRGFLLQLDNRSGIQPNGIRFIIYNSNTGQLDDLKIDNCVPDSGWHHWALRSDGSTVSAYRDGTFIGSYNYQYASTGNAGNELGLGFLTNPTTPLNHINGKMADVRIYDADLTASQISDLYAGTDVTTNLAGHWLTDNDDVEDKAGTNDGTNFGSTYSYDNPPMDLVPSRQASRDFDGVSDHVNLGNSTEFSFSDGNNDEPFSLSTWLKIDDNSTFRILGKDNGIGSDREWLLATDAGGNLNIYLIDGGVFRGREYTTPLPENEWLHISATYDGSGGENFRLGLKLYVNGVQVDNVDFGSGGYVAMDVTTNDVYIGRYATTYSDGKFADVRIYDDELTASEVLDIYNGTTDRTNLIGQWLTNSDDVLDHAGTNDGTNFGSTYSTDSPS